MDHEERELQIKLAQLNAELQIDLAWTFGLIAAAIVFFVFAYQAKESFGVYVLSWVAAFGCMFAAAFWIYKTNECHDKFKELK